MQAIEVWAVAFFAIALALIFSASGIWWSSVSWNICVDERVLGGVGGILRHPPLDWSLVNLKNRGVEPLVLLSSCFDHDFDQNFLVTLFGQKNLAKI